MFLKIAVFEFRLQVKSPVFWVCGLLFFLLTFLSVTSDTIQIGSTSNVHINAPVAVVQTQQIFSIFFMFALVAFAAGVVVRDDETGFGPIVRSTPISKIDYLLGRFCGAFFVVLLAFTSVPLALVLGSAMPWLDAAKLGPIRPLDYVYGYVVVVAPTLFALSAAFFALAAATRSMRAVYVGVVAFLIIYLIALAATAKPELRDAVAYLEPFGIAAVAHAVRYWTPAERNGLLPPLIGPLLWNRAAWTLAGAGFLALGVRIFKMQASAAPSLFGRRRPEGPPPPGAPVAAEGGNHDRTLSPRPAFGAQAVFAQLRARTAFDALQVLRSPAFLVLLALGVLNSVAGLWVTVTSALYGDDIYPVTRVMISTLRGSFTFIPLVVAIYYAGELVWWERDRRTEAITGATPTPDWVFVLPKILAITLVLASLFLVSVVAAIGVQACRGYFSVELAKYWLWYLTPETIDAAQIAVLAIFVQTLAPQKYIGWGLMVLFLIAEIGLPKLGFDQDLYLYGSGPDVPLSDMNGLGLAGVARGWFRLYWSAAAVALSVLTFSLWRRAEGLSLKARLARAPRRLAGPAGGLLALSLTAAAAAGIFIFLNVDVWNAHHSPLEQERWLANYEKTYLKYQDLPQPKITDVTLAVDLHPETPAAVSTGSYIVENKTNAPIATLHVRFDRDLQVRSLVVDGADLLTRDDRFNYRIYRFHTPLQPKERRRVAFVTWRGQRGFKDGDNTTRIVGNGTFLNSQEITPFIGMSRDMLLSDPAKRRKYGLPAQLRAPKLDDPTARGFNALSHDADWVNVDITVSTRADQRPMAPGYEVRETIKGGRRSAEFRTEAPILNFFSIQSAAYAATTQTYRGVALSVLHHPPHDWNVERMIRALKTGLDYDQAQFSPYQFRQVRIVEFPDYAQFAQSFANTIPYSEGIGFIEDERNASKIDMVTYVTAHELGHQWWAHQVIGADMQGAAMLAETFAQYSALMAMKHSLGPDQIRKFLKYELDSYLRSRGGEALEELPLERVEEQPYIYYRKGSLVMYRLQDQIGEAPVNRALRGLVRDYAFKGPPYPSASDFIKRLRQEAGPQNQALITDLFEKITLYDLKAVQAHAVRRKDGRYAVRLVVSAKKLYADGRGRETTAPLNETFDVGVFAREPGKADFGARDVLSMHPMQIHSGSQTIDLVVDQKPVFAGVDPYNKAIDRNSDDNLIRVDGGV